eukprot:3600889-Rhodomonas_salina.1
MDGERGGVGLRSRGGLGRGDGAEGSKRSRVGERGWAVESRRSGIGVWRERVGLSTSRGAGGGWRGRVGLWRRAGRGSGVEMGGGSRGGGGQ